jgi:hypothetical protein
MIRRLTTMKLEVSQNKGERIWGCSKHAIEQFLERNRFLSKDDYKIALYTILKMMNKAIFVTFDLEQNSDIYTYGSWVFVCKESTVVTVYQRKGCKWEHLIS